MEKPIDRYLGHMIRGYRLEELLGRGKATSLYRARTEELWQQPEVIITLLHIPETFSIQISRRFLERFLHEAKRIVQLRHPSLFPLFGYGEEDGLPYLVMPDVSGVSLATHFKQKKRWTPSEILAILEPIAAALTYVHSQGLAYQFFHPTNILFQKDAPPQITGLNLPQILCMAGLEGEKSNTSSYEHLRNIAGGFLGAAEYLAPEVVRGEKVDARSDVYSLGIMLFEMLSGKPPFTGQGYLEVAQKHVQELLPALHEHTPDLPVALELVVNRALHRNLNYRFQTPSELMAAYSQVLDERLHVPKYVHLLPAGEKMRALLTAPKSLMLPSPNNSQKAVPASQLQSAARSQENPSEKKRQTPDGRIIAPLVGLPASSAKGTRQVSDPVSPSRDEKSLGSPREGFLASGPKAAPKPPVSSLERSNRRSDKQPDVHKKSEASQAKNTDIAAMAHQLHQMMRKLQASLSK